MKNLNVLLACTALLLGACGGMYAGGFVDRFINTPFTNPSNPQRNLGTGNPYGYGEGVFYRTEREGSGTRYYIRLYYERCKYSLYVDQNDIIRSWRDEGGSSHIKRCLMR